MFYSQDFIEEVRSRNDIVDVIGSYVSLKKQGSQYKACCPFHHEKTPSFGVSRDKQLYHCFGCGVGGNVFTFVMEYENLGFSEAIQLLAERVGMQVPKMEGSEEDRKREHYNVLLKEMNKNAAAYFHYIMKNSEHGKKAYDYFRKRGLTDETIRKFGLGYADIYRDDLYRYLKKKGYTDGELKDSGLVEIDEKNGGTDKFWNRAMIPILDINGKVIGFGGRVLGDGKPKYINTKDTQVFDKSHTLFAMNIAKRSRKGYIICCEGYMDVISMHQAGFDNAVASLGTAFTPGHANILKRYAKEIYLAYDSDGAGVTATLRNLAILRQFDVPVRVINMKPYKDPDELIQALGTEGFQERINNSESGIMFEVRILSERYDMNDPEQKTKFQNEVAKRLAAIEQKLERDNYVDAVARKYMIDREALASVVTEYGLKGMTVSGVDAGGGAEIVSNRGSDEDRAVTEMKKWRKEGLTSKLLLSWLVNKPELFDRLNGIIDEHCFEEGIYRNVAAHLYKQYRETGSVKPAVIVDTFSEIEEQRLVAEMMQTDIRIDMTEEEASRALTDVVKKVKLSSIEADREAAIAANDMKRLQELILEQNKISKLKINI